MYLNTAVIDFITKLGMIPQTDMEAVQYPDQGPHWHERKPGMLYESCKSCSLTLKFRRYRNDAAHISPASARLSPVCKDNMSKRSLVIPLAGLTNA